MNIDYLKLAGILSFIAAVLHVAIIIGGPDWYRFFGAGEHMALMAEKGLLQPVLMTAMIAVVLSIWGIYAWSGAGMLPRLPLLKIILLLITCVYLCRGIAGLMAPLFPDNLYVAQNTTGFWLISSVICLIFALVHVLGMLQKWHEL